MHRGKDDGNRQRLPAEVEIEEAKKNGQRTGYETPQVRNKVGEEGQGSPKDHEFDAANPKNEHHGDSKDDVDLHFDLELAGYRRIDAADRGEDACGLLVGVSSAHPLRQSARFEQNQHQVEDDLHGFDKDTGRDVGNAFQGLLDTGI